MDQLAHALKAAGVIPQPTVSHSVLVVGGPAVFVKDVLTPRLAAVGVDVISHWSYERSSFMVRKPIPYGCGAVIILTDMISHKMQDAAKVQARKAGVPVILTCRKWSTTFKDIKRQAPTLIVVPENYHAKSEPEAPDALMEKSMQPVPMTSLGDLAQLAGTTVDALYQRAYKRGIFKAGDAPRGSKEPRENRMVPDSRIDELVMLKRQRRNGAVKHVVQAPKDVIPPVGPPPTPDVSLNGLMVLLKETVSRLIDAGVCGISVDVATKKVEVRISL